METKQQLGPLRTKPQYPIQLFIYWTSRLPLTSQSILIDLLARALTGIHLVIRTRAAGPSDPESSPQMTNIESLARSPP